MISLLTTRIPPEDFVDLNADGMPPIPAYIHGITGRMPDRKTQYHENQYENALYQRPYFPPTQSRHFIFRGFQITVVAQRFAVIRVNRTIQTVLT